MSNSNETTPQLSFHSFDAEIAYMNGMYNLPVAPYPTVHDAAAHEVKRTGKYEMFTRNAVASRLRAFKAILEAELDEIDEIIDGLENFDEDRTVDFTDTLVAIADLMGDIQVYCASENARFGIPNSEVLSLIMASNFSKLGADGKPILDPATGKFLKGPNFFAPEPAIKEFLIALIQDFENYGSSTSQKTSSEVKE